MIAAPSRLRLIRKDTVFARFDETRDLNIEEKAARRKWKNAPIMLLFIIRVKRELKRVYRNGCRYNERLNAAHNIFLFFLNR